MGRGGQESVLFAPHNIHEIDPDSHTENGIYNNNKYEEKNMKLKKKKKVSVFSAL